MKAVSTDGPSAAFWQPALCLILKSCIVNLFFIVFVFWGANKVLACLLVSLTHAALSPVADSASIALGCSHPRAIS